jgi:hypothetical protein
MNNDALEERSMSNVVRVPAFEKPKTEIREITIIPAAPVEKQFAADNLEAQKRKFAIAYLAFSGDRAKVRRAGFTDEEISKYLRDPEVQDAFEKGATWTREEIVAKISMEAEFAQRPQDRLNALRMLMEYRGISEPQGGARSFERIMMNYRKST